MAKMLSLSVFLGGESNPPFQIDRPLGATLDLKWPIWGGAIFAWNSIQMHHVDFPTRFSNISAVMPFLFAVWEVFV